LQKHQPIRKKRREGILTSISWPIQAKETVRYTAQTTANAMQNGATAKVRYERGPKNGTLMYDSPACLNHLYNYCNFSSWPLNWQKILKWSNNKHPWVTSFIKTPRQNLQIHNSCIWYINTCCTELESQDELMNFP